MSRRLLIAAALLAACGDALPGDGPRPIPARYWGSAPAPHSGPVALTADGARLVVAHPDLDRVTFVDLARRVVVREVALGPTPVLTSEGRWAPPVAPHSVALAPHRDVAYVTGRNAGELVALDLTAMRVIARASVCTEPTAALVGLSEASVLVACAPDRELVAVDPGSLRVTRRVALPDEPDAMALTDDGAVVVTHPRTGGVTRLDAATLAITARGGVPERPWAGHPLRANGVPRALHDVAQRPGTGELWVPHTLLSVTTAQPALNFETTVFPAITVLDAASPERAPLRPTLTTDSRLAGEDGVILRVISGPRAIAFTPDGAFALVLARNSESLLVVDCARGVERGLLEDLPGRLQDAVVMHPDGRHAWLHARGSGTLLALAVTADGAVALDGAPFASRASDAMPAELRAGQWMFYNANDRYQMFPITVNRWLSCESCHMDGGTAAVTQRFAAGPRDIPDLRQGLDGFLMRTATRRDLDDFWRTIAVEQGGQIRPDDDVFGPSYRALMAYVARAIPPAHAPRTDAALAARGRSLFERPDVGCARCHAGPRATDSGVNNPSLDLRGEVRLYDVGTCAVGGAFPDLAHEDVARRPREACRFDTPTLRGVARSGPWLHDGRAATLRDVLTTHNAGGLHGNTRPLSSDEIDALVEHLRGL